ncbi:hypothetical protein DFA_03505 [Cavenderia fasciculata]|uniref:Uncharacterized protein n=1 Tax=Cavenderia fasciculata TaxID=261658 RepID=F4PHS3_CACFS|nr:uncharacterized protein DFA_03505 [Cavenderia fasciculata]EGG25257.1 hypothetical protein DFA_03505 [Cavenderia fasciculata]|eukprot:XP_004363108.1 hypothetical protein DFA_03505 [Cavenderia fasciculata]
MVKLSLLFLIFILITGFFIQSSTADSEIGFTCRSCLMHSQLNYGECLLANQEPENDCRTRYHILLFECIDAGCANI